MDKYEYTVKTDKIKLLASQGDYTTAAKIADSVEWERVRNIKMLTLVSEVYEEVSRFAEAKEILLKAYELAPAGRRMIYKLTELSVKEGNYVAAEEFFRDFREVAPNDANRFILRYMISSAKREHIDKQIAALEAFRRLDFEERWAYELAELYHKAGREEDCVQLCDEIILWFGTGAYVEKAMKLKMIYRPLTPDQQEKLETGAVLEEPELERPLETQYKKKTKSKEESRTRLSKFAQQESQEDLSSTKEIRITKVPDETRELSDLKKLICQEDVTEEPLINLGAEVTKIAEESGPDEELDPAYWQSLAPTVKEEIKSDTKTEEEAAQEAVKEEVKEESDKLDSMTAAAENEAVDYNFSVFMLEVEDENKAEKAALSVIKASHKAQGTTPLQIARITGSKLNKKGLIKSLERLAGCDLVITEAGNLNTFVVQELENLLKNPPCDMLIAMSDVPEAIQWIRGTSPILTARANYMIAKPKSRDKEVIKVQQESVSKPAENLEAVMEDKKPVTPSREAAEAPVDSGETLQAKRSALREAAPTGDLNNMSMREFVRYMLSYIKEMDCTVDDMAELAIYAKAERMLENGEILSRETAKEVANEAIYQAEKRSLKGVFTGKYDKNGFLILKENHFGD